MDTNKLPAANPEQEKKIEALLNKDSITMDDMNTLTPEERSLFTAMKNKKLSELKGEAFAAFTEKLMPIIPADIKTDIWENNHERICLAIRMIMEKEHRMPSKNEIAKKCGLNRSTVIKHLSEYNHSQAKKEKDERYKLMEHTLLATLYKKAVYGDIKAMKFYFEATGLLHKGKIADNIIETQNNYIQINNLKLSQEEIQKLSPEKLIQIEAIVKGEKGEGSNPSFTS